MWGDVETVRLDWMVRILSMTTIKRVECQTTNSNLIAKITHKHNITAHAKLDQEVKITRH